MVSLGIIWEEEANMQEKLVIAKGILAQPFFTEVFMIGAWCI